jgi:hypothetical protein
MKVEAYPPCVADEGETLPTATHEPGAGHATPSMAELKPAGMVGPTL